MLDAVVEYTEYILYYRPEILNMSCILDHTVGLLLLLSRCGCESVNSSISSALFHKLESRIGEVRNG